MSKALVKSISPDETLMAAQLTEQYKRVTGWPGEVVKFGAMMLNLQEKIVNSARGINSRPMRGPGSSSGSLKQWIKERCPEISISTAWRCMAIAEGIRDKFQIGRRVDLLALLTAEHKDLEPKLLKKRADIRGFLEGKSQRQLLRSFGSDKESAAPGGANQLNKFLREKYPDLVGTPARELPKNIHKEFLAWKHAQTLSPEEQVEQERKLANDFWRKFLTRFHFNFYEADDLPWANTDRDLRQALLSKFEEASAAIRKTLR